MRSSNDSGLTDSQPPRDSDSRPSRDAADTTRSPTIRTADDAVVTADVEVADADLLMSLTGPEGRRLALIERAFDVSAGMRGQTLHLQGPETAVRGAERALAELMDVLQRGMKMPEADVERSLRALRSDPRLRLRDLFQEVALTAARGKRITPKGVAQKAYIQAIRNHDVVFGVGPAGTGKTYLAMAMAVSELQQQRVRRIILTRPAVEAGEKLGFLPGDLAEKVNPYLRPLYDALHDMMDADKAAGLISRGVIEVAPLAFMRGRTLNDSFVILDEAQNTTIPQMKMFLTRLGVRSKAVITGDITQVDLPEGRDSGLNDALRLLGRTEGIHACHFSDADVVRHPLVQRIIRAYEQRDATRMRERMRDADAPSQPTDAAPRGATRRPGVTDEPEDAG